MAGTTLYGIKSCDSVKKARRWLEAGGIEYRFHDVRIDGVERAQVQGWLDQFGLALVNKRSTSWKTLDESRRARLDLDNATELLLELPTLIKRPVLAHGDQHLLGFNAERYRALFPSS